MSAIVTIDKPDGDTPIDESRGVFDFFDPRALGRSLNRMSFTSDRAIELLVDIAESSDSPWARLAALREIHGRLKESLVLTGAVKQISVLTEDTDGDGRRRVLEQSSRGFLTTTAQMANKVFEDRSDPQCSPNVIEAEVVSREEPADHATSEDESPPDPIRSESGSSSGDWTSGGNTFRVDKEGHFPPRRSSAGLSSTGTSKQPV